MGSEMCIRDRWRKAKKRSSRWRPPPPTDLEARGARWDMHASSVARGIRGALPLLRRRAPECFHALKFADLEHARVAMYDRVND